MHAETSKLIVKSEKMRFVSSRALKPRSSKPAMARRRRSRKHRAYLIEGYHAQQHADELKLQQKELAAAAELELLSRSLFVTRLNYAATAAQIQWVLVRSPPHTTCTLQFCIQLWGGWTS